MQIPTLCHHEKLTPFGACRICTVEIDISGWTKLVAACVCDTAFVLSESLSPTSASCSPAGAPDGSRGEWNYSLISGCQWV